MARKPKRAPKRTRKPKRPPRRKVKLLYPEGDASADLFGTDPEDSKRLLELREAIDTHLVWPSVEAEENGDYVGAIVYSGELAAAWLRENGHKSKTRKG